MRVLVNGVYLYFDVDGSALRAHGDEMRELPTLLLLHGGPGVDHSLYKPAFSALTDVAQVVYLDHRGNGRSERGAHDSWNIAQWADDVAAFCNTLGIVPQSCTAPPLVAWWRSPTPLAIRHIPVDSFLSAPQLKPVRMRMQRLLCSLAWAAKPLVRLLAGASLMEIPALRSCDCGWRLRCLCISAPRSTLRRQSALSLTVN